MGSSRKMKPKVKQAKIKGTKRSGEDRVAKEINPNRATDREWLIDIDNWLKQTSSTDKNGKSCIYRIPKTMREVESKAYDPMLVSIGPFHFGEERLDAMDQHKRRFLHRLLHSNTNHGRLETKAPNKNMSMESVAEPSQQHKVTLATLMDAMKGLEKQSRECYDEKLDFEGDQFCLLMIVDGCFILELLREYHKDMITAATETSSTTLEWAMAELVKHPEIMKKAQEEVRRVIGSKSKIEEVDIHQMVYLKSIIKETLRFHPPATLLLPRECIKNTKIQGYDVPSKTVVYINAWSIGRDPVSWERAEEFEPERFLNSDRDYKGKDFMFIPFGAGQRGCTGIPFAVSVMELALANILHQFDWGPPNEVSIQDLDMTESYGITCSKKSPLFLVATPYFN